LTLLLALCVFPVLARIFPTTDFKQYVKQTLGVTVEDHFITTADGYITHAFRFPQKPGAPVVLFQHGNLASMWSYLAHENLEVNAPYVVWKMGYDVWLTNNRGNIFARNSTTIKNITYSKQFWNFTFTEMGVHDVPAHVNYVLEATNRKTLTYVGWSQGTVQFWVAGSDPVVGPLVKEKVNLHVALAPAAWMYHSSSPILTALARLHQGQHLEDIFPYDFLSGGKTTREFEEFMCNITKGYLCHLTVDQFMGKSDLDDTIDIENLVAFFPAGVSSKDISHYEQLIDMNFFRRYDYGTEGNMREYGTPTPPNYTISNYNVPTAFFIGSHDILADVADVVTLQKEMPPAAIVYNRTYDQFSHITWVAGNEKSVYWLEDFKKLVTQYNPL